MKEVGSVVRDHFNRVMTVENGEKALALASTCTLGGATFSQLLGQGLSREFASVTVVAGAYIAKNGAISKSQAGKALLTGFSFVVVTKTAKLLISASKKAKTGIELIGEVASIFSKKKIDNSQQPKSVQEAKQNNSAPPPEKKKLHSLVKKVALMTLKHKKTQKFIASWVVYKLLKHFAPPKVKAVMKRLPF